MINNHLSPKHQDTESRKTFSINYNTGMSRTELLENIQQYENELRIEGIEGELFYRINGRGRDNSFEVFGIRLETDFERDDRVSYYRQRKYEEYESYMDMKLEFEPNGSRTFNEFINTVD